MRHRKMKDATLEQKTLEYWKVSRAARGLGKIVTTGKAIELTGDLLGFTNPARLLWKLTACMQDDIISHGGCKRKTKSKQDQAVVLKISSLST
jgi:hypothetical protein